MAQSAQIISEEIVAYLRGKKMFCDGLLAPPRPDENAADVTVADYVWIGYQLAKCRDFAKRERIAEQLNMPPPEWKE